MKNIKIIENELEHKLILPVVAIQPETIVILDKLASRAEMLNKQEALKLLEYPFRGKKQETKTNISMPQNIAKLRQKRYHHTQNKINLKLYLRYPCFDIKNIVMAMREIASHAKNLLKMQIFIDTGLYSFKWDRLIEMVQILSRMKGEPQIATNVFIDASFLCPNNDHMDFLVRHKIILRYVLGSGLGYSGNIDSKEARILSTVSDYGLRVPVLFYWSDEKIEVVKRILRKALKLNKFSGIDILPCFLSQYFCAENNHSYINGSYFAKMVNAFYEDPLFSEFIGEPICSIEDRMSDCRTRKHISALITNRGQIEPFRAFPFTVLSDNNKANVNTELLPELLQNTDRLLSYKQCKNCAWKHICGGLDNHSDSYREQYKTISDIWCLCQKTFMRQIVDECLKIRNCIQRNKIS